MAWLANVANSRIHATTQRVVNRAFAEEQSALKSLPGGPFRSVLKLERRVSHGGMVSVGGNLYRVPDCTRRRVVEGHSLADEVRIFEAGRLIAVHPVLDSFLALTMQKALEDLSREAGLVPEWKILLRDLDRLQQVRIRHRDNDWLVRTDAAKSIAALFGHAHIALPPREADGAGQTGAAQEIRPQTPRSAAAWWPVAGRIATGGTKKEAPCCATIRCGHV